VAIVIAAHIVSVVAMVVVLLLGDTGRTVDLGIGPASISGVLGGAIGLDGLITAVLVAFFVPAWRAGARQRSAAPRPRFDELRRPERWLLGLLVGFGALFALAAVIYELGAVLNSTQDFFRELPFVTNSVVKVSALAMLSFYVAANLRRNMPLVGPVIAVHFLSPLVQLFYLATLDTSYSLPLLGSDVRMTDVLWGAIALDGVIAVLLLLVYRAA
jgi:hypothetical protein